MYIVEKNGSTRAVRDANQLAAFLNNGWVKVETKVETEEKIVEETVEVVVETEESTEEAKEESKEEAGVVEYTKEEVEKMQFFSLKSLAKKCGIEIDGKKSKELRAELIARL